MTIEQHLNTLRDPWRTLALENVKIYKGGKSKEVLESEAASLKQALSGAFPWAKTVKKPKPEGFFFWAEVVNNPENYQK